MDSVCLQRIKNWARDDLDMKITNSELEKICKAKKIILDGVIH